jgi:hypothetical protein
MNVSDIQKQLEMGIPIEHEHTQDKVLATDIALQHLDEIPDYYTRLKKMEASAKKEHKKFKDVKEATDGVGAKSPNYNLKKWFDDGGWVQAGGKYDGKPCAKQPGQKTKPYCRDPDDRAAMSKDERNERSAKKRKEDPNPNRSGKAKMVTQESAGEKDACYKKVKSRYSVWPSAYASGALVKCRKVGAANWGTKSEACWDGYVAKGIKKKGKKMVPNCVPVNSESTNALDYDWHTPIRERADRYCPKCEKLETRSECKYGPRYWDTFSLPAELIGSKKDYNITMPYPGNFPESVDHEYSMARSEISTIIGAAKRLRKKMKGEGNIKAWVQSKITKAADYIDTAADYVDSGEMKKESVSIEDVNGNHYAEFIDIIKADRLVKETISPTIAGGRSPYKNPSLPKENPDDIKIRIIKGKEPKLPLAKGEGGSPYEPYKAPKEDPKNPYVPAPKRPKVQLAHYESEGTYIEEQVADTDIPSDKKPFDVAIQKIMKRKGQMTPRQRIVALKQAGKLQGIDEGKTFFQFMIEASAAWQRKEGKNPEGGLNKKGIASYRKENPGSNLSLAVTTKPSKLKKGSKSANRRKSFCSRMSGMKKKLTSAKTANDPNSRINKSLRKWNC